MKVEPGLSKFWLHFTAGVMWTSDKPCLFAFLEWTSYPLVVYMIALGIFLRVYSPIPKIYLATVYIGIGFGLFLASLQNTFGELNSRKCETGSAPR